MKRCYVEIPEYYRSWEIEIRNFRESLELELEDSPSLNNFLVEILPKTYQKALKNVREDYPNIDFPDLFPFPADLDELFNRKFWERENS